MSDSSSRVVNEHTSIAFFLKKYGITNDQGQPLDFKDHPYLASIYADWSPRQVIKKAAQGGFSTTIIIKALWAAANRGMDVIYSFPTFDLSRKMVSSKVNRLISNNPIFQELTKDQDSVEQKRIGKNMLYFQGTSNEQAAIAIPADLYIADEVDRSDQKIVEWFSSRLQHSKFQWEWRFSNPSVPENGVDKWWQLSDQKEWFVKCEACGKSNILTIERMDEVGFLCPCGSYVDRRKGEWVPKYRDMDISGYHMSTLMSPQVAPKTIQRWQKEKTDQFFANFVLGEPYVGGGNYLPRHLLLSNITYEHNPQDLPPVIGVDTGKRIHYVVGNQYGIFYNAEVLNYEPIRKILRENVRAIAVIDVGGDQTAPRELQEQFPSRVFLCAFVQSQDTTPRWREEKGMVNVDRNKIIQLVVDEFSERRIPLFGREENWEQYAEHWAHLYREVEEDDRGRRRFIWKRNGPDHLALATIYWRVGMNRVEDGEGEIVGLPAGTNMFPTIGIDLAGNVARFKHL